jgi:hypothetical protein
MSNVLLNTCSEEACAWNAFSKTVGCSSGDGSCSDATFLRAEVSEFHPAELSEVSAKIEEILSEYSRTEDGRKLGLLATPWGVLLAYVDHNVEIPEDRVNNHSSPREIIEALKLLDVKPDETDETRFKLYRKSHGHKPKAS